MEFRGYKAIIQLDEEFGFYGQVQNVDGDVVFTGGSEEELEMAFREAVHRYAAEQLARAEERLVKLQEQIASATNESVRAQLIGDRPGYVSDIERAREELARLEREDG